MDGNQMYRLLRRVNVQVLGGGIAVGVRECECSKNNAVPVIMGEQGLVGGAFGPAEGKGAGSNATDVSGGGVGDK